MIKAIADIFKRRIIAESNQNTVEARNVIMDDISSITIGKNVYIGNWVRIRPGVVIGDNVEIRDHVFLAEGCEIGDRTRIYQYANIAAYTKIGKYCFIGVGTIFANDKEIVYPLPLDGTWKMESPIVKDYVRIGVGAVILPRVVLRSKCRIGAGAVVTKSTEEDMTYVGNPARPVKQKGEQDD